MGRFYTSTQMARVASSACAGCGACCRGMGDTIELDPYDIWQLTSGLHRDFQTLLGESVDLHVQDKVILPHLAMQHRSGSYASEDAISAAKGRAISSGTGTKPGTEIKTDSRAETGTEDCFYLGADGRCAIHAIRPGICRLFPLGRQYDGDKVSYFVVEDGCIRSGSGLSKVRIDKWLGIPSLARYESFKVQWHDLVKTLQARLTAERSAQTAQQVNLYFLQLFFMAPYPYKVEDFYLDAGRRMQEFEEKVL